MSDHDIRSDHSQFGELNDDGTIDIWGGVPSNRLTVDKDKLETLIELTKMSLGGDVVFVDANDDQFKFTTDSSPDWSDLQFDNAGNLERDHLEDCLELLQTANGSFMDYVKKLPCVYQSDVRKPESNFSAECDVEYVNDLFGLDEGRGLDCDDGVEIQFITVEDGEAVIGLRDVRDD
jgi:hypothetical protein